MRVLNRWVVVEEVRETKTVGGLVVHDDKDRYVYSKVYKAGENASGIKPGDFVYFDKAAGKAITYKGVAYKALTDADILIVDD